MSDTYLFEQVPEENERLVNQGYQENDCKNGSGGSGYRVEG